MSNLTFRLLLEWRVKSGRVKIRVLAHDLVQLGLGHKFLGRGLLLLRRRENLVKVCKYVASSGLAQGAGATEQPANNTDKTSSTPDVVSGNVVKRLMGIFENQTATASTVQTFDSLDNVYIPK